MEYITLKNTDLNVSRIGMGGCPLGQFGWGFVQEQELIETVYTALDKGINFFDTADVYGLGKSEETLAKSLDGHRSKVIIASKFGVRVENGHTFYDNSPQWIQIALERSLKRLKTDYIDLYQIHYLDGKTPIADIVDYLDRLKEKGYIRYYGLSNIHKGDLNRLLPYTGYFANVQDEYSLACRKNEQDLLDISNKLSVTPMTWGSLGQGILTGKYNKDTVFDGTDRRSRDIYVNFHGDKLIKNLQIVDSMRPIASKHNVSIAAVAVRFILDHLKDSIVLVGAKRPSQIIGSIESSGWKLSNDEYAELCNISK